MTPADLSLVKNTPTTPAPDDVDTDTTEEPMTFTDRLPGLAVAGGYVAAGLVLLLACNIAVGLLIALHGLHLATWVLLVIYCLIGGGIARAAKEQERVLKAVTLQWASYRAWTTEELPQAWERQMARGRTVRGWVWQSREDG
ncbi:hypothetical protein [Streptomyces sp. NPDC048142]|uniref:hypothetical protein n=1 Tax=Streptomyces sp. NPDC048142 TaxID=3365501 RepID=UPI0037192392